MVGAPWMDYLHAAHRKLAIASAFHLTGLRGALDRTPSPNPSGDPEPAAVPPLAVQGHFEGMLYCILAACDQGLGALKRAYGLPEKIKGKEVVARLREDEPDLASDLAQWWKDPLVQDAHKVRNLAVHHFTGKQLGGSGWKIDAPPDCPAPHSRRELLAYASDLLERGATLSSLLARLEAFLESRHNN